MSSQHLHHLEPAPQTRGRTIHWASHYDSFVKLLTLGKDSAIRTATVNLANIQPGETILDAGCGTGDLTLAAKLRAGADGAVFGIDAAPEMIDTAIAKARERHMDINFRAGVIESLPYADNSFDVVLSSLMMHHLPDDLKVQGLHEIHRVLRPDGRLLIVDAMRPMNLHSRFMLVFLQHGALQKGVQDLPDLLREVGFAAIETGTIKPFPLLGFVRAGAQTKANSAESM